MLQLLHCVITVFQKKKGTLSNNLLESYLEYPFSVDVPGQFSTIGFTY